MEQVLSHGQSEHVRVVDRNDAWVIYATEIIPLIDYPPGRNCSSAPSRCTAERSRP